jgi:hypothetical protein
MLSGSLKVKLRPLRLAFVVEPNDRASLLLAIQTTTFLWGGSYNPIIPFYRRLPNGWAGRRSGIKSTAKAVLDGYLEAFDPDFVVPVGKLEKEKLQFGHREVVKCSEILDSDLEDEAPNLGIGLFEVFKGFADEELKYVRSHPIPFCVPVPTKGEELFLASLFGLLPSTVLAEFDRALPEFPGLSRVGCVGSQYLDRLDKGTLSFRRLGFWKIEASRDRHSHADCVFYMDSRDPRDIIDFWNLRALGWSVVPVCRRTASDPDVRKGVALVVDRNFFPFRGNPDIYNHTLLLPSRPELTAEAARFAHALVLKESPKGGQSPLVICPHYPRIWDAWARAKDGGLPCRLEVDEAEAPLGAGEDRIRFPALVPNFASRFGGRDGRRCANEIELRVWGHEKPFAEVIPEGGDALVRAVADMGLRDWRCGASGPIYFPRHKNWHEAVALTASEPVVIAWLKERGWAAEISDKGHIAIQMFRQLGGIYGLSFLAINGMVDFLGRVARAGTINSQEFFGGLTRLVALPGNQFAKVDHLAQRLVSNQMVQLGIEVQCPRCRQRSWYSMADARYGLKCTKCLSDFPLPSHSPRDIVWTYRALGAFSLPSTGQFRLRDQTYGSLTVLLAVRFFSQLLHASTTPMFSFKIKKGATEFEADLGLFFRESKYKACGIEQLFCECKSFNPFERKDGRRMRALGAEFPGAFLVFVTLNKTLSEKEKRILRPIVNRGRRYWKNERPYNPVLILTGNELFAEYSLETTWRELGGVYAQRAQRWGYENRLLDLADATQEIYLGMPTWHAWLRQRFRRNRLPKIVGPVPTPPVTANGPQEPVPDPPMTFPVRLRQVPFM